MPEIWKSLLALFMATLTSLAGTVCIRLASEHTLLWLAIAGGSLWSLSGAAFMFASSSKGVETGAASALMSAGGILAINLIGIFYWAESANDPKKLLALGLIVLAIILLALPTAKL